MSIRSNLSRRAVCLSLVCSATLVPGAIWANPIRALAVTLPVAGEVPMTAGIYDLGRADGSVNVQLALVMAYRNEAQLDALIDAKGESGAPLAGRPLTASQFRDTFSPTVQTYAGTIAQLRRAGFTITHTFANRTVIDASASALVVNRYFQTEIHHVAVDGVGRHYANARAAYLPAGLSGAVRYVLGFDDIEWFKPLHGVALTGGVFDAHIGQPLKGPSGEYGPLAFAQGYDMPVQHQIPGEPVGTTYDGTGRIAGIAIPADPSDADLAMFLKFFRVARTGTTSRILVNGGPRNHSRDAEMEAALDYQTIAGVAPGATIDLFEFPRFTGKDVLDAYNTAVDKDQADTINSSFGACETANLFNAKAIAAIFKQGLVQGQIFHASTGDAGTTGGDVRASRCRRRPTRPTGSRSAERR